ncbi:MAG: glycosyltransferase family 2 protein [Acidimicrobiales bacterium]|nr:glycosyltransferase family 2 protein [Acidimicrobiales bacterium]
MPPSDTSATPAPRGTGRTLVIIPAWNEEEALPAVLADLARVVPDLDVVVIDDGSADRTAAVGRAAGATVLQLPFNLGIGGALRTGFRYAVDQGYERGVQFDADGQHDPHEIASLLASLDSGVDMAIGSRFAGKPTTYDVGRVRRRAMGVLRFAVKQFSGQSFTDTSSGFRAFSRPVLEFFARTYPSEYMESVEALLLACSAGFRVAEVPVHMRGRDAGAPSTRRFRLAYHYVRLLLVIVVSAPRRRRLQEIPS